jgi:hypothetical protein
MTRPSLVYSYKMSGTNEEEEEYEEQIEQE